MIARHNAVTVHVCPRKLARPRARRQNNVVGVETLALNFKAVRVDEFSEPTNKMYLFKVQVLEILIGDARDGDIVNVHFVALDQMQQQVEGALEFLELDLVGRGVVVVVHDAE